MTTPAPASTPRAFLQRSLAALGRFALARGPCVDFSRPREMLYSCPSHHADLAVSILVQTAHISARRLSSSSCSTARIEIVRPRGHGQRIHRRHLWSLGPVSGERNVADGRRKPTVLSQRFRSAIRPIEASKAAVCYVHNTSTPAVRCGVSHCGDHHETMRGWSWAPMGCRPCGLRSSQFFTQLRTQRAQLDCVPL